jgi:hypothetical protein
MYGSVKLADLPMSKRHRARLDKHAKDQAKHREDLAEKKAPDREDFGRAALTTILILYDAACNRLEDKDAGLELATTLRRGVVEHLEHVGFDGEQSAIRFDKMADRAVKDHERWRVKREWHAEAKAQKKASAGKEASAQK